METLSHRNKQFIRMAVACLFLVFSSSSVFAQIKISGRVLDGNKQPLPGVSIQIMGTTSGSVTDLDGNYSLTVPNSNAVLKFSYIGFLDQTITVGGQTKIDVTMGEDAKMLGEVLVVGYGTMKKEDKTGAVASVTTGELQQGVMIETVKALQGKAAGVQVSKSGGDPNAGFSVKIRGQAGLSSGTDPLYVIDGVPGANPNTIAPSDIETFTILKDASSTAIYGTRGANGVIMITTKKGPGGAKGECEGNTVLEVNSNVSVDVVSKRIDLVSAEDYRAFASQKYADFKDGGANTNWQDEIFQTGITTTQNAAFSGSTNKSSYRASMTYNDFDGVIKNSSKQSGTGLISVTHKAIDDRLYLEGGLSGAVEQNHWVQYGGNGPRDVLYQAFQRNPTDPVYNADGSYFESTRSFQYYNPVSLLDQIKDDRDQLSLRMNINAKFDIWRGLKAGINAAYIRIDGENGYYIPTTVAAINASGNERQSQRAFDSYTSKLTEFTLSYDETIFDKHTINAVAGYSYESDFKDGFAAQGKKSLSDYVGYDNLAVLTVVNPGDITSYRQSWKLISFFGRVAYNYDSRYYATVTVRNDGSSKFGANNKWGFFPSASLGWSIKNEQFMQDVDVLSSLKLRVGAGKTGNQNIDPYMSLTTYAATGTTVDPETGETVVVFQGNRNPNPDLKWEENLEYNAGVDFGLFKDRLSGSFEFYKKRTQNLLASYDVATPPNLYGQTFANGGTIDNTGFEATIQAWIFDNRNLTWKTGLVFSTNKQVLKSLLSDDGKYGWTQARQEGWVNGRGMVGENYTQIIREGEQLGTFWLPEFAGISSDGAFLYKTAAGGVTRDASKAARYVAGYAQPKFELGWSNYFTFFKNFDASFSLRGVFGHSVYNGTEMYFGNPFVFPTLSGTYSAMELAKKGVTSSPNASDYYLEKASFVRLDDITIGYSIPFAANKYITKARVYVTSNNLFTITNYSGLDPEVSYSGLSFGVENYNVYPRVRSFLFGVQIQF